MRKKILIALLSIGIPVMVSLLIIKSSSSLGNGVANLLVTLMTLVASVCFLSTIFRVWNDVEECLLGNTVLLVSLTILYFMFPYTSIFGFSFRLGKETMLWLASNLK